MIEHVIKDVFGFEALRPLQREAIDAVMAGRDAVVVMPTGGGKSLCYQAPALLFEGVTIVVSPLIALMKDQVDGLRENGVVAAFWNSTLSQNQVSDIIDELQKKLIKLLYIAPERFSSPQFLEIAKWLAPSLIAIDEAHCVSEWGHDFRPEYRNLHQIKELFPGVPRIALTATATDKVAEDISTTLKLDNPVYVRGSFDRPNLFYDVRPKNEAYQAIVNFLRHEAKGPGIIYCGSRKKVEDLASRLKDDGFSVIHYHAGLSDQERCEHQEQFIHDKVQIIVATIAFGMGIDKSNVRFIIHHDIPKSIEAYYQETGRAGRDGAQATCVLFFSHADRFLIESFIEKMSDPEERDRCMKKLSTMCAFASKHVCRRRQVLCYFGEEYPHASCQACDICSTTQQTIDATEIAYSVLASVIQLRERFGMKLVIDVLRGADTEKTRTLQADRLAIYGKLANLPAEYLRLVIEALIRQKYLQVAEGLYPTLSLTDKAKLASVTKEPIFLPIPPFAAKKAKSQKVQFPTATAEKKPIDYDEALFNALRTKRKAIAEERKVPPYIIFHDSTLQEIARQKPRTESDLLQISGVGKYKLETFGQPFLEVIQCHPT